jgi:hypothetical protein
MHLEGEKVLLKGFSIIFKERNRTFKG